MCAVVMRIPKYSGSANRTAARIRPRSLQMCMADNRRYVNTESPAHLPEIQGFRQQESGCPRTGITSECVSQTTPGRSSGYTGSKRKSSTLGPEESSKKDRVWIGGAWAGGGVLRLARHNPRWLSIFLMTAGFSIKAMTFMLPEHFGHMRGSTSYIFWINRAQLLRQTRFAFIYVDANRLKAYS